MVAAWVTRRDRGGAGHGIRQPDVKRDLGGFTGHADQHEQGDQQDHGGVRGSHLGCLAEDVPELQAAEGPEHGEGCQQEAEIADAVGNKRFLGCVELAHEGRPSVSISYQKPINRKEHRPTPSQPTKQHQVRVAADQDHHHGNEQVQEDEETAVAPHVVFETHILVHVANGVNVNERADT